MAEPTQWPHKKSLKKMFGNIEINLGYGCDLLHGKCWMCRAWNWNTIVCGHGFSQNKFTAVRMAIKDLSKQ